MLVGKRMKLNNGYLKETLIYDKDEYYDNIYRAIRCFNEYNYKNRKLDYIEEDEKHYIFHVYTEIK